MWLVATQILRRIKSLKYFVCKIRKKKIKSIKSVEESQLSKITPGRRATNESRVEETVLRWSILLNYGNKSGAIKMTNPGGSVIE